MSGVPLTEGDLAGYLWHIGKERMALYRKGRKMTMNPRFSAWTSTDDRHRPLLQVDLRSRDPQAFSLLG